MKKTIYISGNCITEAIPIILKTNNEFNKLFEIKTLKPVFMVEHKDVPTFHEEISKCDIFITQPIGGEKYKQLGIDTETMKDLMKEGSKLISIPVPYFVGYFPEQFYLHDANKNVIGLCEGLPSPYHNKIILYSYLNNLTPQECLDLLNQDNCLKNIANYSNEGIDELKRREECLDFGIADFIKKNYKKKRLFWSLNHPTNELLYYMCEEILKLLGIKKKWWQLTSQIKPFRKEFLDGFITPILPSTKKELALSFSGKEAYTIEYINDTYIYYDNHKDLVELNKIFTEDLF